MGHEPQLCFIELPWIYGLMAFPPFICFALSLMVNRKIHLWAVKGSNISMRLTPAEEHVCTRGRFSLHVRATFDMSLQFTPFSTHVFPKTERLNSVSHPASRQLPYKPNVVTVYTLLKPVYFKVLLS